MITTVAVEPPAQVQRHAVLYPPLVVVCNTNEYDFFQIQLVDSYGYVVEQPDILQGTPSAVPQALESSSRSRNPRAYAVFPNISIATTGSYTIQVNGFRMDYESVPPCMVHAVQIASRDVRVRSSPVAQQQPSNSEARVLDILAQNGLL